MKNDIKAPTSGKEIIAELHSKKAEQTAIDKALKQNKAFKFWAFALLFTILGVAGGTYIGIHAEKFMDNERTTAVEASQLSLKDQTPQE